MAKQKQNKIVDIRIRLGGEVKKHFLEIKEAKGLTNNTEVLRLLIQEASERLEKEEAS